MFRSSRGGAFLESPRRWPEGKRLQLAGEGSRFSGHHFADLDERQKECGDGSNLRGSEPHQAGEKGNQSTFGSGNFFAETAQHPLFEGRVGAFFRERIFK